MGRKSAGFAKINKDDPVIEKLDDIEQPLRLFLTRNAYGEIVAHAQGSLEAEICGVLVGDAQEEHGGIRIEIKAAIRGIDAEQGGSHVTFTQETWNYIHQRMDSEFPKLKIVGWYHSHPGFGVSFSEMDLFIQENFFPSPHQVACVIDPLGGKIAFCYNTPIGPKYMERFWVDGREHLCVCPADPKNTEEEGSDEQVNVLRKELQVVETRLNQVIETLDEQRVAFQRFLMTIFITFTICIIGLVGYTIYNSTVSRMKPPELRSYLPVPLRIDNKTVMLGIGIVQWEVPPEMDALSQAEKILKKSRETRHGQKKMK